MRKKCIYFIVVMCLCITMHQMTLNHISLANNPQPTKPVIVIDPGHGGPDSGAVGVDQVSEKDLNLSIAKLLKKTLSASGFDVIMTREDDLKTQFPEGEWSKMKDMSMRRETIESSNADMIVSIHMNSFPSDPSVHGAQVFYGNEQSKDMADKIQTALIEKINDGTSRTAMNKNDMYIFDTVDTVEILIECGFLSSAVDAGALQNPKRQKEIAQAVGDCITDTFFQRTDIYEKEQNMWITSS